MLSDYITDPRTIERFWAKVVIGDGCWLWQGGTDNRGYGVFAYKATNPCRFTKAHRFSFALHGGPFDEGFHVCHHCDVPGCVNPAHLFLGTQADNIRDMHAKGRGFLIPPGLGTRGEEVTQSKLVAAQVREIRALYATGQYRQIDIAERFGVTKGNVSAIVARRTWKHVA